MGNDPGWEVEAAVHRDEAQLVEAIVGAYRRGLFPMADPDSGRLGWYRSDPRGVIPLEAFRAPKNVRRRVGSGRFVIRADTAFRRVICACAAPRPYETRSWIDDRIVRAYTVLHRAGSAHSVEAWLAVERAPRDVLALAPASPEVDESPAGQADLGVPMYDEHRRHILVGGLYGVHIGGLFAGESMFSVPPLGGTDASKVCLVHLAQHLRSRGVVLLDAQFPNAHLEQFGCVAIPAREYDDRLRRALAVRAEWGQWQSGKVTE